MSLSNPVNPPIVNEAVAKPASTGASFGIDENQTKVNQIHGIASNNAKGAGIPKQVSNAQVSVANAAQGSTCTVAVLFKADPTDSLLSGVNIWVKGYQGNSNPVLVGSGTSSPTKIVLNNTGETVTFIIQAFGNGGNAPFSQAPTCSGTLPKSTSGGFGSSTVTAPLASLVMPAEFSVSQIGSIITVDKATESPNTFWSGPSAFAAAGAKPAFRRQVFQDISAWPGFFCVNADISQISNFQIFGMGQWTTLAGTNTITRTAATATEPMMMNDSTTGVGATIHTGHSIANTATGFLLGPFKRLTMRVRANAITTCGYYFGLVQTNSMFGGAVNWSDTPNFNYIGFRFSSTADTTNWTAMCGTATASQTTANTGVAVSTTASQILQIDFDSANSKVVFSINGTIVATISTNIPASSAIMQPVVAVCNRGTAVARTFDLCYLNCFYA